MKRIMLKRIVLGVLVGALTVVGLAVQSEPAAAGTYRLSLERGWNAWTKEYCQDGTLKHWQRLKWGKDRQGRVYVYVRNGRLCTYTVDHMPGSHVINLFVKNPHTRVGYSQDHGYYTDYAGALTAPKSARCIYFTTYVVPREGYHYRRMGQVCKG